MSYFVFALQGPSVFGKEKKEKNMQSCSFESVSQPLTRSGYEISDPASEPVIDNHTPFMMPRENDY